ncbi:MAG: Hpt domain-containing protein [Burkholderiales bacterium]
MTSSDEIVVTVEAGLADLVPTFLANCRAHARTLRTAAAAGDLATAASVGHNLTGSGTSYGFEQISDLGRAIERLAKGRDARAVADLAQQLEDYLSRVRTVSG